MKRVGITQRVIYAERIKERRDALDQRWQGFSAACGMMLVPIPNNLKSPSQYAEKMELDGLIFSGGNNLGFHEKGIIEGKSLPNDDVAYERDNTELSLIKWAIAKEKPIIGVCRGMQALNVYFGGRLNKVDAKKHVAKEHPLAFREELQNFYSEESVVNSYHNWGITHNGLAKVLAPLATSDRFEIEAFKHQNLPFIGIMWHPERYMECRNSDILFFRKVFYIEDKELVNSKVE